MESLTSAYIGLAGSVAVAAAVYFGQTYQSGVSAALALHREFNTGANQESRNRAWDFIKANPRATYEDIAEESFAFSGKDYRTDLWAIMRFWEHLSVLIKARAVNRRLATRLFAPIFVWWWEFSLKAQLVDDAGHEWQVKADIQWLYSYFHSRKLMNAQGWESWTKDGRSHRLKALANTA